MKRCCAVYLLFWLGIVGLLAGCAGKPVGPASQETLQTRALKPAPGKALVYYYNHRLFLGATNVTLDKLTSAIGSNKYVVWEIEPGKHRLEFSYQSLFAHKFELELTCAADQTYYFFLQSETRFDLPSDDPNRNTYAIVAADEQTGRAQIEKFGLAGWFEDGVLVPPAEAK